MESLVDVAEVEGLELSAGLLASALRHGRHRGGGRGQSSEFYDYRGYAPGDDARRIDWKVWGRSDRLFVRQFAHQAEVGLHLVLDASASMAFASLGRRPGRSKYLFAATVGAGLAALALRQGDPVRVTVLQESGARGLPVQRGAAALRAVCTALLAVEPGGGPAWGSATAVEAGRGTLAVVFSDFLDEPGGWTGVFDRWLACGAEVRGVQVLAEDELHPESAGGAGSGRYVEPESGEAVEATLSEAGSAYRRRLGAHLDLVCGAMTARRCAHVLASTGSEPVEALAAAARGRMEPRSTG